MKLFPSARKLQEKPSSWEMKISGLISLPATLFGRNWTSSAPSWAGRGSKGHERMFLSIYASLWSQLPVMTLTLPSWHCQCRLLTFWQEKAACIKSHLSRWTCELAEYWNLYFESWMLKVIILSFCKTLKTQQEPSHSHRFMVWTCCKPRGFWIAAHWNLLFQVCFCKTLKSEGKPQHNQKFVVGTCCKIRLLWQGLQLSRKPAALVKIITIFTAGRGRRKGLCGFSWVNTCWLVCTCSFFVHTAWTWIVVHVKDPMATFWYETQVPGALRYPVNTSQSNQSDDCGNS